MKKTPIFQVHGLYEELKHHEEPLSVLQRMSEDLQYSDILDKAAQCQDSFMMFQFFIQSMNS